RASGATAASSSSTASSARGGARCVSAPATSRRWRSWPSTASASASPSDDGPMILIGVDQGTTGTRTVAFDERLEPVAEASRRVAVTHPQPGWIAKDAEEVVRSVQDTVAEVVEAVGGPAVVTAIGLDNEGETVVAWDPATGRPVADAVVWGCRR